MIRRVLVLALLDTAIACCLVAMAVAAPPEGIDQNSETAQWFRTLRNPATGAFCCDKADGHILADRDWRIAGDGYEVRISGEWQSVPHEAVLDRVDNPTGAMVAFYLPGQTNVRCLVRPTDI